MQKNFYRNLIYNIVFAVVVSISLNAKDLTPEQIQYKSNEENLLRQKILNQLTPILGMDKAKVNVSIDYDFSKMRAQNYDSNTIIRSEQNLNQEPQKQSLGIAKIIVDIKVDGKYLEKIDPNGNKIIQYTPLNKDELQKITSIVQNSMGFNAQRGDTVRVENVKFKEF